MINREIKLFDDSEARLTTYILDDGEYARKGIKRPAVIVCPGGGYTFVSKNEGEPVALSYASKGYSAFVLDYSVKIDNPFPTALKELAKAVSLVRENAAEWLIDSEDITVVGFSAGGHLALTLGINYQQSFLLDDLGLLAEDIKPNNLVLGYPAVVLEADEDREIAAEIIELMDKGLMPDFRGPSIQEILLGHKNPTQEEIASLNLLQYIDEDMPRIFIWGTYEDTVIPTSDLLGLANKLNHYKVPVELHLYQKGPHGMSLADKTVKSKKEVSNLSLSSWFNLSIDWLEQGRI